MKIWNGSAYVNYVDDSAAKTFAWDGVNYIEVERLFFGEPDPTDEGFIGTTGDAWFALPGGDYVSQAEFDAQGPSGRELAYASSTAYQSGLTGATITGLSISFTVAARPVKVRLVLPLTGTTVVGTTYWASISDGGGTAIVSSTITAPIAAGQLAMMVEERITTPGSYSRTARLDRFAGTGTIFNNYSPSGTASIISFLEAIEQ